MADAATELRPARLRESSDSEPGIRRRRHGQGFVYVDADGKVVRDRTVLDRIRALAIPPAWTDVWICVDGRGHLQATGRDAKHRKQYRYHDDWRRQRDSDKFDQLADFGLALPRLRDRLDQDMRTASLDRRRVVASTVWLLDQTYIRVGNDEYVRSAESYGLTTLRNRHATIDGSVLRLRFNGKAGKRHDVTVRDRRVANTLRRCRELPGQHLIQYVDGQAVRRVDSREVNAYLQDVMNAPFTAKTFRTWGASLVVFETLSGLPEPGTRRQANAHVKAAIALAAERLGNTPAVCRGSYVHPALPAVYLEHGSLRASPVDGRAARRWMSTDERRLVRFLGDC